MNAAFSMPKYAPRAAGFLFLFLIVMVGGSSLLWGAGVSSTGAVETVSNVRLSLALTIAAAIATLALAGMLYAMVLPQDGSLAALALACRTVEAGTYVVGILCALLLLSNGAPAETLLELRWIGANLSVIFFAPGSTVFCYLLWKARLIPVPLALLGLIGSLIVLVGVPVQTALSNPTYSGASAVIWVPVAAFEIVTGFWLLIKGATLRAG